MKRRAYIVFSSSHTVTINTNFKPQKTFDLRKLQGAQSIDLVTLKVVDVYNNAEHPFTAMIWGGDGSQESPFILMVHDHNQHSRHKSVGTIERGETKEFSAYVE